MVLATARNKPGLRFILGACVLGLCIYAFYIVRARQVTPELFLVPESIRIQEYACKVVKFDGLLVCIPTSLGVNRQPDGLHVYSLSDKVTGLLQIKAQLPHGSAWRKSLDKPLIKTFLGETGAMDTFTLMLSILEKRYNPTLMGPKARLIPPWMRGHTEARILHLEGMQALCFYTSHQSLGIRFLGDNKVITLSTTGRLDQALVVGILGAITPP